MTVRRTSALDSVVAPSQIKGYCILLLPRPALVPVVVAPSQIKGNYMDPAILQIGMDVVAPSQIKGNYMGPQKTLQNPALSPPLKSRGTT